MGPCRRARNDTDMTGKREASDCLRTAGAGFSRRKDALSRGACVPAHAEHEARGRSLPDLAGSFFSRLFNAADDGSHCICIAWFSFSYDGLIVVFSSRVGLPGPSLDAICF